MELSFFGEAECDIFSWGPKSLAAPLFICPISISTGGCNSAIIKNAFQKTFVLPLKQAISWVIYCVIWFSCGWLEEYSWTKVQRENSVFTDAFLSHKHFSAISELHRLVLAFSQSFKLSKCKNVLTLWCHSAVISGSWRICDLPRLLHLNHGCQSEVNSLWSLSNLKLLSSPPPPVSKLRGSFLLCWNLIHCTARI